MKKTYQEPETMIMGVAISPLLSNSPGVSSENGIGYGGVDENGEHDPASRRRRRNQWDDEEEEDEW